MQTACAFNFYTTIFLCFQLVWGNCFNLVPFTGGVYPSLRVLICACTWRVHINLRVQFVQPQRISNFFCLLTLCGGVLLWGPSHISSCVYFYAYFAWNIVALTCTTTWSRCLGRAPFCEGGDGFVSHCVVWCVRVVVILRCILYNNVFQLGCTPPAILAVVFNIVCRTLFGRVL